jgi:hypothetical protein
MTSLTEKTLLTVTLPQLNAGVSVPRYDRRHVSTGIVHLLLEYMTQEAIPTLRPVPGIDLQHYARELIERFSRFTRVYTSIMASIREHGVRRTLADLDRYATSSMADREPAGLERKSP